MAPGFVYIYIERERERDVRVFFFTRSFVWSSYKTEFLLCPLIQSIVLSSDSKISSDLSDAEKAERTSLVFFHVFNVPQ